MNNKVGAAILFFFLEFIKSLCDEKSTTAKFNKISFNNKTSYYNVAFPRFPTSSRFVPNRKWKIERITNKQYGIVNILWQKTKVFIEQNYSNITYKALTIEITSSIPKQIISQKGASKLSNPQRKLQPSTPSYIEFYYWDQGDDRIKRKHPGNTKLKQLKKNNKTNIKCSNNKKYAVSSLFKIHINTVRRKPQPTKSVQKVGQNSIYRNKVSKSKQATFVSKIQLSLTTKSKMRNTKQVNTIRSQQSIRILNKTTPVNDITERNERNKNGVKNNSYNKDFVVETTSDIKSFLVPASTSAAYDKVKFFEMYDNNTPKWKNYMSTTISNNINKEMNDRNDEQILLHHTHDNIGHQNKNNTVYVKKHTQDLYSKDKSNQLKNNSKYFTSHDTKFSFNDSEHQVSFQKNYSWSRPAVWSEYPFVAVYIYEPSQVHCDAAGISPHWLLAAASCLSRHRKRFQLGGLSAFVAFCGNNWKYPQMISYVKRTLIHPLHHPKDRLRRLFNAGLVQIVNSMADTCSGWAPVSLISHQFTAAEKGSIGMAVGWGLDRYDESFTASNIPSHPLMLYEGKVYSQTCPGNAEYSLAKRSDEVSVRSVYCLLLPPYVAEENDTVHGALLLIGGKLLALYLKEERRPWGVQSAQYASIWRLLPWLAETAREPDESFQIEI